MGLPSMNPIDFGWLPKGATVDHTGTVKFDCRACGPDQKGENYRISFGGGVGFGAPWFVSPFLKRRSSRGKIGGKKGDFTQCCRCGSLWPRNAQTREVLASIGANPDGVMNDAAVYEMENREAAAREARSSTDSPERSATGRARKLAPEE